MCVGKRKKGGSLSRNLSYKLVCVDLTYYFIIIAGVKQTNALKQEDASKRYENYLENCINIYICLSHV